MHQKEIPAAASLTKSPLEVCCKHLYKIAPCRTDNQVKNWYNNTHGKEEKKRSKDESRKRRADDMEEESTATTATGMESTLRA